MTDVFVSYSRHDAAFVHELHDVLDRRRPGRLGRLGGHPAGVGVGARTSTTRSTRPRASSSSSAPSSLASKYCTEELGHAQKGGKRVVPIAIDGADPAAAPPALRELNWIWCRDDRRPRRGVRGARARARHRPRVVAGAHAAARPRGRVGRAQGRQPAPARQGSRGGRAASWRANAGKEPRPTELQQLYLHASRRAAARRQRALLGGVTRRSSSRSRSASSPCSSATRRTTGRASRESKTLAVQAVDALASRAAHRARRAVEASRRASRRRPAWRYGGRCSRTRSSGRFPAAGEADGRRAASLAWSADGGRCSGLAPNGQLRVRPAARRAARTRRRARGRRRASVPPAACSPRSAGSGASGGRGRAP